MLVCDKCPSLLIEFWSSEAFQEIGNALSHLFLKETEKGFVLKGRVRVKQQ
jgi:hypothetical protein